MVHPLQCKAIASARLKNDKAGAAKLLRADLLPEAQLALPEVRQLWAMLRHWAPVARHTRAARRRPRGHRRRPGADRRPAAADRPAGPRGPSAGRASSPDLPPAEQPGFRAQAAEAREQGSGRDCPLVALASCTLIARRTLREMVRVPSGQASAWPLASDRRGVRGAPTLKGWIPKMLSTKRFERIFGCP
jgi:hypothetical protein